jgi:hypothetical protein
MLVLIDYCGTRKSSFSEEKANSDVTPARGVPVFSSSATEQGVHRLKLFLNVFIPIACFVFQGSICLTHVRLFLHHPAGASAISSGKGLLFGTDEASRISNLVLGMGLDSIGPQCLSYTT